MTTCNEVNVRLKVFTCNNILVNWVRENLSSFGKTTVLILHISVLVFISDLLNCICICLLCFCAGILLVD